MSSVILYSEIIKCFPDAVLADLVYSQVIPGPFGSWYDEGTVPSGSTWLSILAY